MTFQLFAVTAPGLEAFTRQELGHLGLPSLPAGDDPDSGSGGVEFEAGKEGLYHANLQLRTTSRILARLGIFYATLHAELRKKASRLPWEQYLRPGQPVALRVTCHRSAIYHSGAAAERVTGGITDRLGAPVNVVKFDEDADQVPQLVVVRIAADQVTISIDSSGPLLHRRGYRLETAKAPLRETLAAGLLLAAGWDGSMPLLDPFCGSGTIPIEAALVAKQIAPGLNRRFAFMDWPNFDAGLWAQIQRKAAAAVLTSAPSILGSDRDAGAIRISQSNAARAGVGESTTFTCTAFSAISPPPGPGWMITNPPYGLRVQSPHDLRNLYTRLGDVLRSTCPGWGVGILCADDILAGHTRLKFERILPLINGGVRVNFFIGHS